MRTVGLLASRSLKIVLLLHLLPAMLFFYWFLIAGLPVLPVAWLATIFAPEPLRDAVVAILLLLGSLLVGALLAVWVYRTYPTDIAVIARESWFGRCFVRAVCLSGAIYVPLWALVVVMEFSPASFHVEGANQSLLAAKVMAGILLSAVTFGAAAIISEPVLTVQGITMTGKGALVAVDALVTIFVVKMLLDLAVDNQVPGFSSRLAVFGYTLSEKISPFMLYIYQWFVLGWFVVVLLSAMVVGDLLLDRIGIDLIR